MIIIIQHKYRELTIEASLTPDCRDISEIIRKAADILLRDFEDSQGILPLISISVGKFPKFQFIKPTSSTNIRQILQGQPLQCHFSISD